MWDSCGGHAKDLRGADLWVAGWDGAGAMDWCIPRDFAGREAKLGGERQELSASFQGDEML